MTDWSAGNLSKACTMTILEAYIPARPLFYQRVEPFRLSLSDRRVLLGAIAGLVAVRLVLMFWLPFTDTTEARYAEIARKMAESADWITPQFDYGVPFWGKPPLHTWLSAMGMRVFGVGEFGARIFIFLSGLGVLGLVGAFLKRHARGEQALVATCVLFSSVMFFGASAFVMTDMAMTLGTTLSMVAFFNHATDTQQRKVWGNLFFAGLAIGLLAKGPVATVLTLMPVGLWVLTGRRWAALRSLPWLSGLVLLLLLALPWYVAAEMKTPGFLRYFIVGEHFERFVVPGWQGDLYGTGHHQPKGMIWVYALGIFLPWTLFAGLLALRAPRVAQVVREDAQGWYSYLLFWAIAPLLLFTPAANILPAYGLPGLPAATLLLVSLWAAVQGAPGWATKALFGLSVGFVIAAFLALAILVRVSPDSLNLKSHKALVEAAMKVDPEIHLTHWGGRSYSAEFYTAGKTTATTDRQQLRGLLTNGVRDAVAVSPASLDTVTAVLGDRFTTLGKFGRDMLLVETAIDGDRK